MSTRSFPVAMFAAACMTLPIIAACGATSGSPVAGASPTATPITTPTPSPIPSPGPAIGDVCVVGTWSVLTSTIDVPIQTKQGVVSVVVSGGAGMVEHLFSDGTAEEDLAGATFTGSGGGYRVVVRARGQLQSPVIFMNGYATFEPIDASGDHSTISVNGGESKALPQGEYEQLTYTCTGNSLTESDGVGETYDYQRVSATP